MKPMIRRCGEDESGIALVLALFLTATLSVLASALMFLSQTETYASQNYRMMSQSRYAGEAAIHKAADFLLDTAQYPQVTAGDPLLDPAQCNYTVSPVTCGGNPVILSATDTQASNYPVAAVQTAFHNAVAGTLSAGNSSLNYSAYATLISMQSFESIAGPGVAQVWRVTGKGEQGGTRKAKVEVSTVIEVPKISASTYGAFATDNTCGALNFAGNVTINSYDSTGMTGGSNPTMSSEGGDVGTNGNLTIAGSVDVQGNLYTPRTGVGSCTDGNVVALTESGNAEVSGSVVQLPKAIDYPAPTVPAPSMLPAVTLSSAGTTATTCAALGLVPVTQCNVSGNNIVINGNGAPLTLPSITMTSNFTLVLVASSPSAAYNINSISLQGQAEIAVQATSPTQSVLVNVSGKNPDGSNIATPIDFAGGTYASVQGCGSCSNYDASMLQFLYGGTGNIVLTGNSGAAATFYAPYANATVEGTADLYGALLAKRINMQGSGNIHYDRRLSRDFYVAGQPMPTTFSWKRD